eukprot:m.311463 g.311463  ORF g.311463 m.311463 type:complete len:491 (+) comp71993_c0_seq1:1-1473(+)
MGVLLRSLFLLLLPLIAAILTVCFFGTFVFVPVENDFESLKHLHDSNPASKSRWFTYERLESEEPSRWHQPETIDQIVAVVISASQNCERIRVVGAGHSWAPLGLTNGNLINFDKFSRILDIDSSSMRVTVQSGIRLRDLNQKLFLQGLALENIGSVDTQSMGGAISTSTHGSGLKYGSISTKVLWMEVLLANGSIVNVTQDQPELYGAMRTGLGSLGIITIVQLQCSKAFHIHREETLMDTELLMEKWSEYVNTLDHFSYWWIPYTSAVRLVKMTRVSVNERVNKTGAFSHQNYGGLSLYTAAQIGWWAGSWLPGLVPYIMAYYIQPLFSSDVMYTDTALEGLKLKPPHIHNELEYFIDLDKYAECYNTLLDFILKADNFKTNFIVQTRFSAKDDIWLSPMFGKAQAAIAIMMYNQDAKAYFDGAERIFQSFKGRPHWGKKHSATTQYFQRVYPRFDDFLRVRDELDPRGIFMNDHLERIYSRSPLCQH